MKILFMGRVVERAPAIVLSLVMLLTMFFSILIPYVESDFDIEHFLPPIEENEAEKFISNFFEGGKVNSLYLVLHGKNVLNKTIMLEISEIENNLSFRNEISHCLTYVDLLVKAEKLKSMFENVSVYGKEFINADFNFTLHKKILRSVENITDSYNKSIGSPVEFGSNHIIMAFSELHNFTYLEWSNNSSAEIRISIYGKNMYERAQSSMCLHNKILWYEIALRSAKQILPILSPNYSKEIEYWKSILTYIEAENNNSARKMLKEKKNITSQNLTILYIGWKEIFEPYNNSLKALLENISANIIIPYLINYTLQNTSTNIEVLKEISNNLGWNLSETINMLEKYKENITLLWKSINETDIERYLIDTVKFQTIYLIMNYTGQIRRTLSALRNDLNFIDNILNALDNATTNETVSKIYSKIDELNNEKAAFEQFLERMESWQRYLSSKLIVYTKLALKSYYQIIMGNFSNQEKELIDNMIVNIMDFIFFMQLLNRSHLSFISVNIDPAKFTYSDPKEIIMNLNVEKTLKFLENLDVNFYTQLIENISIKLYALEEEIETLWYYLKNITYVLYSYNLVVPFKLYESLRISSEENLTLIIRVIDYTPVVLNLLRSVQDLIDGIRDMLSKDFDYNSAKASILIIYVNWKPLNYSEEKMIEFQKKLFKEINRKIGKYNVEVYAVSTVLMTDELKPLIDEVLKKILPLAIIMIFSTMTVLFRSILDSAIVLAGVCLAIIWMNGTAVVAKIKIDQLTIVAMSLVVGLGVDFGIHTIMRYREYIKMGYSVRKAAAKSAEAVSLPLALGAITTGIAFLSNLTAPLPPIQHFGILCSTGVTYSFIIMSLFIPSIKIIIDERREKKGIGILRKANEEKISDRSYLLINKICKNHRGSVLAIVIILALIGIYLSTKVPVTFRLEDFLPDNSNTIKTIDFLEANFRASTYHAKILYIGNIDSLTLKEIDKFMLALRDNKYALYTQSESITTYIKNSMISNPDFRKICEDLDGDLLPDRNISTVLYWLYENDRSNASKFYTISLNSTVIYVKSLARTTDEMKAFHEELKEDSKVVSRGKVIITGTPILTSIIFERLQESMISSTIFTLIISTVILIIAFYRVSTSPILGIVTILPVMVVLSWIYITMFLLRITFNGVTATILSLTVGMGIPYSIHISHRFIEEYMGKGDYYEASYRAIRYTGSALLNSALTTVIGFGVLIISSIPPLREFGILSSTTIIYSFISSVVFLPTLLITWVKLKIPRI